MDKVQANYSIPQDIKDSFDKYCEKKFLNKSGVVSAQIQGFLIKNGVKIKKRKL